MISRYTHGGLVWVDLESPTQDEVREIMEEFSINPLIAEELLLPTLKPKVDYFKEYMYLILHFPALRHSHNPAATDQEIDFVIGNKFIITTRYDTVDPLHEFSKVFEVESILDRENIGDHAGYVFFYMVRKMYRAVGHELEHLSDELKEIENRMFQGEEREMVLRISEVSKDLINYKRTLGAHKDTLASFEKGSPDFFPDFSYYAKSISGEYYRIFTEVVSQMDAVHELRETNNSLVSTKQNEIMKILTIMAFVTFPLSLVAGIFGMNTQYLPIVGHPFDFWIIISGMVFATMLFFTFFKYKKWL